MLEKYVTEFTVELDLLSLSPWKQRANQPVCQRGRFFEFPVHPIYLVRL